MVTATAKSALLALIQVGVALLVLVAMSVVTRSIGGEGMAERTSPFANAHLLEEVVEGHFHPLTDPVLLVTALCTALLAFGVTTAGALRSGLLVSSNALWAVGLAVGALALLRHWVFASGYPPPMRWAYVFHLAVCAIAGFGVASYNRLRHAS